MTPLEFRLEEVTSSMAAKYRCGTPLAARSFLLGARAGSELLRSAFDGVRFCSLV